LNFEGTSDPYAVLFTSTIIPSKRPGQEYRHWNKFGETKPKKDTLNPVWDETFIFQYINGTGQVLDTLAHKIQNEIVAIGLI